MAEKGSGAPKRTTRPRRRTVVTEDAVETGAAESAAPVESAPPRPAIEDAFEEAAAAREEFGDGLGDRDRDNDRDFPPAGSHESAQADEAGDNRDSGEPREPGAAPPAGPGDYDNSDAGRRRRRRRRGGRNGYEQGPGPAGPPVNQNGGYPRQQQPGRFRQGNNQQGGPRRAGPPPRGYQNHQNQGGPSQYREPAAPPRMDGPGIPMQGILELHPKGYGFLRDAKAGYFSQETDPFVSSSLIQKLGLREGVLITGEAVSGGRGQGPRLRQVDTIEGRTPDNYREVKNFDELTAITPHHQIKLETGQTPVTMRIMDLLTPIAKGQRALLVAPPRTGKTMLLQEIADAVSHNHPEVYLMVLLIDERPEEVTEMKRRVRGEVIASSLDRELENHIRVSQLVFERAKRMTEAGRDVFLLLDSITRTARAFNKWSNSGRTGTGGLDIRAMDLPKKMFGNARQFEEGGSLTVVGTALIETGSRMDDAIFQEFKGTGNMEMVLSRDLADRRIWPAIDVSKSGTRREEKILPPDVLESVTLLRRSLISLSPVEAMEQLIKTLGKFPTNADFLAKVKAVM
ncbi:MAG: transcription termination factor Rho [Planctomycetaceae bacterium]|nr:transcription termination factor Rho [Planctomycetaceae bacterium]